MEFYAHMASKSQSEWRADVAGPLFREMHQAEASKDFVLINLPG